MPCAMHTFAIVSCAAVDVNVDEPREHKVVAKVEERFGGRAWSPLRDAHDAAVHDEPQGLCGAGVCGGGERHRGQLPRYVE